MDWISNVQAPESLQTDETRQVWRHHAALRLVSTSHLAMVLYSLVWLCVYATQQTQDMNLILW